MEFIVQIKCYYSNIYRKRVFVMFLNGLVKQWCNHHNNCYHIEVADVL